ncbi:MAG TPA: outer membrane lipoprotein carrier protein LolA [Thermoanaerobaculia bacterium]|jgi:outer membrane lipoprotein-sorting protein|nr:outer membrane lipoprotein carrier protein LolA [Thermoanaerobaculia bacterium]
MRARTALPFLLLLLLAGGVRADSTPDPWALLGKARAQMQQTGAQLWSFRQTYLPTGFDRGEEETGRVALDLPRCVRWDYDDPYPKSFLLCGEKLWTWNPGEPAGHIYDLDQAQPGLDLLLLAVGDLAERYDARAQPAGNAIRVQLVPKVAANQAASANVLRDAAILLGADGSVRELTYRDAEGNRTTFRFADRRPLPNGTVFTPPANVKWQRETGADHP